MYPFTPDVLGAIEDAVAAASRDGRGVVLLLETDSPVGRVGAPGPELLTGGFDEPGARGAFVAGEETYTDPDALIAALQERLGSDGAVLTLTDLDLGLPTINWSDYFLLRALPPLLRAHPLVVVATISSAGLDVGIVAELSETGLLQVLDPGAAPVADDAHEQLRRAFAPLGPEAEAKGYEVARQTLRIAALEGREFTVAALARVLDEDEDALSDLFDDHLVWDDEHPDAPLDELGFFQAPDRSLFRYRFRDAAFWRALHGDDASVRRAARRYVQALEDVYGPQAPEALFRVWTLLRLAGDDNGVPFYWPANGLATVEDRVRLLAAEAAAHEGPDAPRDPAALVAAARRILQNVGAVALDRETVLRYAQLVRDLIARGEEALPAERRGNAWSDAYQLLGVAALGHGWLGDRARCEAARRDLLDPLDRLALAHQTTTVAEALLEVLAAGDADTEAHLGLVVPWVDEALRDPARIEGLLNEADGMLAGVAADERSHTEAHVLHARAGLAFVAGKQDRALSLDRRALLLLRDEAEDTCGLQAAVRARLTEG
ncbi:hypothetical protein OM076_04505 [Solirubrobacter ginsenosidimutans]|uniref:Uncharacterized protein n=1 Tax=Solirubrobacter ginsenosidimutans TaxID=490573 RepID=A0A9X3MQV1_9ACTN|nr:hypothetical protein [Solirubrobacter ginsenosidimutans]MDA0159515.1 hypothetical protein [Solirubrobacter ginsenosidimutans]